MNLFRDIERRIDERLRRLFGGDAAPAGTEGVATPAGGGAAEGWFTDTTQP